MDKFLMGGLSKASVPNTEKITNSENDKISHPADVACGSKQKVDKSFARANSDGPWVVDAAKKGGSLTPADKLFPNDHTEFYTSHK